jgi:hypothetical protein
MRDSSGSPPGGIITTAAVPAARAGHVPLTAPRSWTTRAALIYLHGDDERQRKLAASVSEHARAVLPGAATSAPEASESGTSWKRERAASSWSEQYTALTCGFMWGRLGESNRSSLGESEPSHATAGNH